MKILWQFPGDYSLWVYFTLRHNLTITWVLFIHESTIMSYQDPKYNVSTIIINNTTIIPLLCLNLACKLDQLYTKIIQTVYKRTTVSEQNRRLVKSTRMRQSAVKRPHPLQGLRDAVPWVLVATPGTLQGMKMDEWWISWVRRLKPKSMLWKNCV